MATGLTNVSNLNNTFQTHFSRQLLQHAVDRLAFAEYAEQAELPAASGAHATGSGPTARPQITFFRRKRADGTNVRTLTEGQPIDTYTRVEFETVSCNLIAIGEAAKITDIASATALFNVLKQATQLLGEDMALKADTMIRNAVVDGLANTPTRVYAQGHTDLSDLVGAPSSEARLTANDLLLAQTRLRANLAPSWNGQYIAILPPATCYDLMRDTQWVDAARYAGSRQIFKGEVGEYMGVRVVETTNPYEVNVAGYDNNEAIGPVYANIVTGKGAYGVPRLTGKNAFSSPYRPTLLINDQPDKADPLNQFITVGWKAYYNAMLLNPNWVTSIVARTQFSG